MFSGNPMPTKPVVATVSPSRMSCTASRAVTILPFSKFLSPWSNSRPCWLIPSPWFRAAVNADHRAAGSSDRLLARPPCGPTVIGDSPCRASSDAARFALLHAALFGSLAILAGPGSRSCVRIRRRGARDDGIKLHSEEIVDLHTTTPTDRPLRLQARPLLLDGAVRVQADGRPPASTRGRTTRWGALRPDARRLVAHRTGRRIVHRADGAAARPAADGHGRQRHQPDRPRALHLPLSVTRRSA